MPGSVYVDHGVLNVIHNPSLRVSIADIATFDVVGRGLYRRLKIIDRTGRERFVGLGLVQADTSHITSELTKLIDEAS